jgi:hypothetical protein
MVATCITVTVLTPASIAATVITPAATTCITPCAPINVDITWTNSGQTADVFTPTMIIDATPYPLTSESLAGLTSVTKTFVVTGLTRGIHTITSTPSGATSKTITAQAPASIIGKTIITNLGAGPTQSCTSPCPLTVSVTWENTGDISGSYTPNISIDTIPATPAAYSSEALAGLTTSAVKTFTVTGLTSAPHVICPYPA